MAHTKDLLHFMSPSGISLSKVKQIFSLDKGVTQTKQKHIQKIQYHGNSLYIVKHSIKKDINFLKKQYNFHPIHLEDIISSIQRPKIDFEKNYIFFVLHYPKNNLESQKIESIEIDFFLTKNDVIIIVNNNFPPFEDLINGLSKKIKLRQQYFSKGAGFLLYNILDNLIDAIFPLLDQIEKKLEEIDQKIFSGEAKRMVEQLSFLRRNVIFFQTLIKPELNSFLEIEGKKHILIDEELKKYFTNITDHLKKIWDRLEDISELSNNLSFTFESYVGFKMNETIKVLTIFSVILMPLTLLSGIYGMNLSFLPLANHPLALFMIGLLMISIVIIMLAIFALKNWI